jgi:hypothetical protein
MFKLHSVCQDVGEVVKKQTHVNAVWNKANEDKLVAIVLLAEQQFDEFIVVQMFVLRFSDCHVKVFQVLVEPFDLENPNLDLPELSYNFPLLRKLSVNRLK